MAWRLLCSEFGIESVRCSVSGGPPHDPHITDAVNFSVRIQNPRQQPPQKADEIMLVLTRKRNDKIRIGSEIVITVTKIENGKVKLGIEAPAQIRILRSELPEFVAKPEHAVPQLRNSSHWTPLNKPNGATNPGNRENPLHYSTNLAADIEDQICCPLEP